MGQGQLVQDNDPFVPNTFIGSFRMEMQQFENNAETSDGPLSIRFWSSADKTLMAFAPEESDGMEMKMLSDLKAKWTYMMMSDDDGTKTAIKTHKMKFVPSASTDQDADHTTFTVTKETRMIQGHLCTKVIGTSKEGTWTGWVAQDIPVPFADVMRNMQAQEGGGQTRDWSALKGFPLEFEMVEQGGKDKMSFQVKDLQVGAVDASVFSLDGYQVMEMPSMGR